MGEQSPRCGVLPGHHRARPRFYDPGAVAHRTLGPRTGENKLNDDQRVLINQIARTHRHIGRAWTLKEQLRDIYRLNHPPGVARQHLRRWITAAKRSRINAFVALAKRLQVYFDAVIAAIELGISNALIEGINAKIRLINARGYGHHSAQALSSMIYLCRRPTPQTPHKNVRSRTPRPATYWPRPSGRASRSGTCLRCVASTARP